MIFLSTLLFGTCFLSANVSCNEFKGQTFHDPVYQICDEKNVFIQHPSLEDILKLPLHPNKQVLLRILTEDGMRLEDHTTTTKYSLKEGFTSLPIYLQPLNIEAVYGQDQGYRFYRSTESTTHWIVNFSDELFLNFIETELYAQEEYLASCIPSLYFVRRALKEISPEILEIGENAVVATKGAKLYGRVDTFSPLAKSGLSIYGNQFQNTDIEDLIPLTQIEPYPYPLNILSIVAPDCGTEKCGQKYARADLETLLKQAFLGMMVVKESSNSNPITVETGNWGAGSFGNSPIVTALMQLLAAHCAGIDQLIFYPLENQSSWEYTLEIFYNVVVPKICDGEIVTLKDFLDFLESSSEEFHLTYGKSNLT